MQTLLVVLAVLSASAAAIPLNANTDTANTNPTIPLTSTQFLKAVLADNAGMVVDDVVSMLSVQGLTEAAIIAQQINLRNIVQDSGFSKCKIFFFC